MSLQQLKEELKENLEHKGVLNQVRASLRASIFQVISSASESRLPPKQTQSQILLHLLMLDYMKWVGFKYSSSIFEQEASIGAEAEFSRDFLAKEIGLNGYGDKDIPVLYTLIQKLINEQRGDSQENEVTDSMEYLKDAWLKHEKKSSYEEYETKLGASISSSNNRTSYSVSEGSLTSNDEQSEDHEHSDTFTEGETENVTDDSTVDVTEGDVTEGDAGNSDQDSDYEEESEVTESQDRPFILKR